MSALTSLGRLFGNVPASPRLSNRSSRITSISADGHHHRRRRIQYRLHLATAALVSVPMLVASFIIFAPCIARAFQATSATEPVSYSFISMDIPNSKSELGLSSLVDINNEGELVGGISLDFSFLIDRKFRSTDIQCPDPVSAQPNAQPQSINQHGEISGFCGFGRELPEALIRVFPVSIQTTSTYINHIHATVKRATVVGSDVWSQNEP